jgi:hypothetical protein
MRAWLLLLMAYALAGCTTTLSARVTSFQKWPRGVVGQTYRLERSPGQVNNLEYQTYADMVRAAIGPTGLVEAKAGAKARFTVTFSYDAVQDHEWVQRFADPYFPGPYGPRWGYYGWGPYGGGAFYPPPVVNVPVSVYKNTLTVSITDSKQDGAQVYQSSAVCATPGNSLAKVMPYLARAVFDHFPGNNGQVRIVRYDVTER